MVCPDGRLHLSFNGEILNYRQLREGLKATRSAPAGTPRSCSLCSTATVRTGATSCAASSSTPFTTPMTGELSLFRDRMGILPLYYTSTIPRSSSRRRSRHSCLRCRDGPGSTWPACTTTFAPVCPRAVHAVRGSPQAACRAPAPGRPRPAGSHGGCWSLPDHVRPDAVPRQASISSMRRCLTASPTPWSPTFPSGPTSRGLDSSLIVALPHGFAAARAVATFSAGFRDSRADELPWARQVSELLGTATTRSWSARDFIEPCGPADLASRRAVSEPADVAVYRLAELARRDVKVVFSGEGSDELFAGYPEVPAARLAEVVGAGPVPSAAPAALARSRASACRSGRAAIALGRVAAPARGDRLGLGSRHSPTASGLRSSDLPRVPPEAGMTMPAATPCGGCSTRIATAWLSDNLLDRGDRMCMASSVELRPPFLDQRLVELAFRLPSSVKFRGGTDEVDRQGGRPPILAGRGRRPTKGGLPRLRWDAWFRGGSAGYGLGQADLPRLGRRHSAGRRRRPQAPVPPPFGCRQ